MDYENFDLYQWSSRRDTLVKWIETYHPELSGFNFDMTGYNGLICASDFGLWVPPFSVQTVPLFTVRFVPL